MLRVMRFILPTLFILAAIAVPAGAASYRVGIGDQNAAIFDDSRFAATGIKRVRYLVPWDYAKHPGQHVEVASFVNRADATGRELFVTFTASRGCWANNRYSRASRCRAPSSTAYRRAFQAFRKQFPSVKAFAPWNEANHKSQPTASSALRAASYYNVLRKYCRGCTLVAADVLDQAGVTGYLRTFLRYANGSPRRWGLHNYSDVNRRRSTGTRAVLRTVPGEVWLTETGGVVVFGKSFPRSESRASNRTRYMFSLADSYKTRRSGMRSRITRIYPYSWFGDARGARFDAGLMDPNGSPRRAYSTFKSMVARRSK
jgi:hypothetical protein